jgi:hypothetical protein
MKNTLLSLAFATATAAAAACAATTVPESADQAVNAAEPAPDLSGTWVFDLEASGVAAQLREHCVKKSPGDASAQAACWSAINAEARTEKIRFAKSGDTTVWTSFGDKGGSEVVFRQATVELSSDGQGRVLAKLAGPHAAEAPKGFSPMRIEVSADGRRLSLADPKKGRLVYEKTP